jgi:hypothetical protein
MAKEMIKEEKSAIESVDQMLEKVDRIAVKPQDEEIEVEFYNLENPGLTIKFAYGSTKNKKIYTLFHGGKYKLPRSVVKHISTRQMPLWNYTSDGTGRLRKNLLGYKSRFECRTAW